MWISKTCNDNKLAPDDFVIFIISWYSICAFMVLAVMCCFVVIIHLMYKKYSQVNVWGFIFIGGF